MALARVIYCSLLFSAAAFADGPMSGGSSMATPMPNEWPSTPICSSGYFDVESKEIKCSPLTTRIKPACETCGGLVGSDPVTIEVTIPSSVRVPSMNTGLPLCPGNASPETKNSSTGIGWAGCPANNVVVPDKTPGKQAGSAYWNRPTFR